MKYMLCMDDSRARKKEKPATLSALFPMAVYGLIHILTERLPFGAETRSLVLLCLEAAFWGVFFFLCRRRGTLNAYRIRLPGRIPARSLLLLAIPAAQLCLYGAPDTSLPGLLSGAFGEELVFRAWLPACLKQNTGCSLRGRAWLSSGLFGLFHMINLISRQTLPVCLLQAWYGFCAGMAFFTVAETQDSILFCFLLHLLLNCTASPARENSALAAGMTGVFSAVFLLYALIWFVKHKQEGRKTDEPLY